MPNLATLVPRVPDRLHGLVDPWDQTFPDVVRWRDLQKFRKLKYGLKWTQEKLCLAGDWCRGTAWPSKPLGLPSLQGPWQPITQSSCWGVARHNLDPPTRKNWMFVCISIRCPEWSKGTNHLANDHWVQVLWTELLFLKQSQAWNLKAGSFGFRFAYVSVVPFGLRRIINSLR